MNDDDTKPQCGDLWQYENYANELYLGLILDVEHNSDKSVSCNIYVLRSPRDKSFVQNWCIEWRADGWTLFSRQ